MGGFDRGTDRGEPSARSRERVFADPRRARRSRIRSLAAVALGVVACDGHAQTAAPAAFPEKPIRLIVPLPPGGGADAMARTLAPRLTELWGHTLVIDNRGGAGGVLGVSLAAKAPPDGYTIMSGYMAPISVNVSLVKLPYDPVRDLAPITLAAVAQNVMTVHPGVPATSVKELIAALRAKPGQYNYASAGSGSSPHLTAELFKQMTQTSMNHVPYKGAGPALTDVIAGQVALYIGSMPASIPHIKSGRVRALAVTGARRSPALPDTPTVSESGVAGFESIQWYGFLAPAKTPAAILDRLQRDFTAALTNPGVKERLLPQGFEVIGSSREEFGKYIRDDIAKWAKVIAAAKIRAE